MNVNKEFKKFFEIFFIPICRFSGRYIGNEEDAVDIAQEVFIKVYEKWEEFDTEDNAKAFLYTIARNHCLDYIKHIRAQNNYLSVCNQEEECEQTFLKEVTRQETYRILYTAIEHLPRQTRQVILYSLQGATNEEIGEKMGISINTVKTLKKNAYVALRCVISKEYWILLLFLSFDI
ncbi:MAG: RNA polymerase sigma-70 factor [Odoribacter sp.]